jgi:hypothetical protein
VPLLLRQDGRAAWLRRNALPFPLQLRRHADRQPVRRLTGDALPHCQFSVEQAYEGDGESYDCVNRRFFDCSDAGSEGIKAFDLRDV